MSDAILISLIAGGFTIANTIIMTFLNRKLKTIHKEFNGMKDKLVEQSETIGYQKGTADEKQHNLDNPNK